METLKDALLKAPALRPPIFFLQTEEEKQIFLTVDTSPTAAGWTLGQEDGNQRFSIKFGAKVLNARQKNYSQLKRELWGMYTSLKNDRAYFQGAKVVLETDCKPLIGIIKNCDTHDLAMLSWVAYIKSFDLDIRHIKGKDNVVADILWRGEFQFNF